MKKDGGHFGGETRVGKFRETAADTTFITLQLKKKTKKTMSPPTYGDLGKNARDVFGKGYHFSLVKLDLKTKTASGIEFNTSGSSNTDNGKVAGALETKYKFKDYGLTFTEKWNTDNQLSTTLDIQDQVLKGLKLTFDSTFSPQTG